MEQAQGRHGRSGCRVVVVGRANSGRSTTVDFLMVHRSPEAQNWTSLEQVKAELERGEPLSRGPSEKLAIVDVSGHKDFVKNLVAGTSQAELVLLFVSAAPDEFEAGLAELTPRDVPLRVVVVVNVKTKALLELCRTLGVVRVVVAVNKMDTVDWSQERFEAIQRELRALPQPSIGHSGLVSVPVSGLHGTNVVDTPGAGDDRLGWWSGPTLLQALLDASMPPAGSSSFKPLRVPIQDVYLIGGVGSVVLGPVASGVVRPGVSISFALCGLTSSIKALEVHSGGAPEHIEGDHTGFSLTVQPTAANTVIRGDVCGSAQHDPPRRCTSFTAALVLLGGQSLVIRPDDVVRVRCHFVVVACRVTRLVAKVSRRTGACVEAAPAQIRHADVAEVELTPLRPLCVEAFADYGSALGRLVLEIADQAVAVGLVKTVTKAEEEADDEEGEQQEDDGVA